MELPMKRFAIAVSTLAIGAVGASAADMPVKAPIVPVAVFSWTGCYVGANVGGMIGRDQYDNSMGGDFLTGGVFTNPANNALLNHSYNPSPGVVTGGGQIGCNYQSGIWVFGVEADINTAGRMSTTANYGLAGPFVGVAPFFLASSHTESVSKELKWYSTFRGRVGFTATPNLLLYATGGLAVASVNATTNIAFAQDGAFLGGFPFIGSTTQTRTGWALGAGAEWGLTSNWSIKAEYLHIDLGSFTYAAPCTPATICGAANSNFLWNTRVQAREEIFRVGVNYRFGGPVVAKY
jgi:outer membrane immunogenic protein